MVKNKNNKLHQLFIAFVKIGVFGYGGGSATIPLFHKEVVDRFKWMTEDEFSDMLSIMHMLPGPMQTKMAGYVGYKVKGILGILSGLAGIILPSLMLMISLLLTLDSLNSEDPRIIGLKLAVLPVVGILMSLLTWQFYKKSEKTVGIPVTMLLIVLSGILLIPLNFHPGMVILPLLLFAFFRPKEDRKALFVGSAIFVMLLTVGLLFKFDVMSVPTLGTVGLAGGNDYVKIFLAFFIPGIIGFGGGPASIPLFKAEVVERYGWLSDEGFAEIIGLGNTLPGVTATKIAGYVGFDVGAVDGVIGSLIGMSVGIFAMVAPSLIAMIILLNLLTKHKDSPRVKRLSNYVKPTIAVLLGMLAFNFFYDAARGLNVIQTLIMALLSLVLLKKFKVHPVFVIIGALIYGVIYGWLFLS
ncbi:chromate transporter [Haloplasma contractile]|uniref:Chromate transporter family protein n=1 Tax=Haloplasma contractile SSD-17B TaxID=1033810 RepID=F7Q208_9MOLU|nr:chromate transporter [Haloplasma contractile]ERJ12184.1 Chromate transporter family protein [Haloplasma contractile SSD-17B]